MAIIERSVQVNRPLRAVYDQWTRFEEFPLFMEGIREVRQLHDNKVAWTALVGVLEKEWQAEIVQQVPDSLITWRSVEGTKNSGSVAFSALDDHTTLVRLTLSYEIEGWWEQVGHAIGMMDFTIDEDLSRFKKFVESRGIIPEGWRGAITPTTSPVHKKAKRAAPRKEKRDHRSPPTDRHKRLGAPKTKPAGRSAKRSAQ